MAEAMTRRVEHASATRSNPRPRILARCFGASIDVDRHGRQRPQGVSGTARGVTKPALAKRHPATARVGSRGGVARRVEYHLRCCGEVCVDVAKRR